MMVKTGFRKQSDALRTSERYAESFTGLENGVESFALLNMVKRIQSTIGLNGTDINVLEMLFLFSQKQDWVEGARPIVWPSNDILSQRLNRSVGSIKRSLSKLIRKGIIAAKDSPNGKRYGRRVGGIRTAIAEAYGFDLSPMAVRHDDFMDMDDRQNAVYQAYKAVKKKITICRRIIRMTIVAAKDAKFDGDWGQYEYDVSKRPSNYDSAVLVFEALKVLQTNLLEQYDNALKRTNMSPLGTKNDTHIENTTDLNISISNETVLKMNCSSEQSSKDLKIAKRDLIGMQKNSGANLVWGQEKTSAEPIKLSYGLMKKACPEFQNYLKGESVRDYANAANTVRSMLGVSKDGWLQAQNAMGLNQSIVAIAIMLENFEKINNHGGYLRGMTKKAVAGDLNLVGSLIGLVH